MRDIWGFLLQTLTASGAAVLLLVVKAMFRDKLSPRWQFAIWGILGIVLLLPAGFGGRYVLFNWPLLVEAVKTLLTGSYMLTEVTAAVPLPVFSVPQSLFDWLFLLYFAGVIVMLLRYLLSYKRLRSILRRGVPAGEETQGRLRSLAGRYGLSLCSAVEVEGLSSAFVCGVFRPVLALPAGSGTDEKVLLHELLHLKHRDVLWGLLICLFRCIHWCNPLLWYCADRAGNDLEACCDQRVLEHLEGEERRDYGRILLAMSNDRYARMPGTSSMANGGKNIGRRIEAIARFKRYPAGMALVSVCVAVLLAAPLVLGTQAESVYSGNAGSSPVDLEVALASARTVRCTTPAGALDAYGKSLLEQNGIYRAMCAPMGMQEEIAARVREREEKGRYPTWDTGLPAWPDRTNGYCVYNLEPVGQNAYQGLMLLSLNYRPDDYPPKPPEEQDKNWNYLAVQTVLVEKEKGRWVVVPQGDFDVVEILGPAWLTWCYSELPAYVYTGTSGNIRIEVYQWKAFTVDNTIEETNDFSWAFGATTRFDSTPKPDAQFDEVHWLQILQCVYEGGEDGKAGITRLGASIAPWREGEERPVLKDAGSGTSAGSSSSGAAWGGRDLSGDWAGVTLSDGGTTAGFDSSSFELPDCYAADLYINGEKTAELTLRLQEGGAA